MNPRVFFTAKSKLVKGRELVQVAHLQLASNLQGSLLDMSISLITIRASSLNTSLILKTRLKTRLRLNPHNAQIETFFIMRVSYL